MSKRLSPAERLRTQIDEVFAGGQDLSRAIEQVAQLGAQLLLQCALEAQVTMMLGRERYERAASCQDACAGMRNGYCATTIKTTAGPVTLQRPKVRGTTERVADRLFGKGVTKTNALESLVIAGFVRGLSVRDVEAALAEALGPQATVSKSTVSRICTQIKTQFEAFSQRRLDDVELDYLFLDGSHFKYHVGAAAEPVLAAWGIDTDDNVRCVSCRLGHGLDTIRAWGTAEHSLGEPSAHRLGRATPRRISIAHTWPADMHIPRPRNCPVEGGYRCTDLQNRGGRESVTGRVSRTAHPTR